MTGWAGRTVATFGDSITWYDGKKFTAPHVEAGQFAVGYQSYMRNDLGCTVLNYGVSGYAMREVSALLRGTDLAGVDAVTITAGANDFKDGEPIGTIAPIGTAHPTSTFIGALQTAVEWIATNHPSIQVFLLTPIKGWTNALGLMPEIWPQAIIDVGALHGLPVCDWYADSGIEDATKSLYIGDGETVSYDLHPTNAGYEQMGNVLTPFLIQNQSRRRGAAVVCL